MGRKNFRLRYRYDEEERRWFRYTDMMSKQRKLNILIKKIDKMCQKHLIDWVLNIDGPHLKLASVEYCRKFFGRDVIEEIRNEYKTMMLQTGKNNGQRQY